MPLRSREINDQPTEARLEQLFQSRLRKEIRRAIALDVNDHGGLTGLGDDDHTHYLLIDGTRAMTGNLDLDGNLIILDADGDSYIDTSVDDVVDFYIFGGKTVSIERDAAPPNQRWLRMGTNAYLDLGGVGFGRIYFDADLDSYLTSFGSDDVLRLYLGGSPVYTWTTTELEIQVDLDLDGNNIWLDVDKDCRIYAAADDDIRINVASTDYLRLTGFEIILDSSVAIRFAEGWGFYLDTDLDSWIYCPSDDIVHIGVASFDYFRLSVGNLELRNCDLEIDIDHKIILDTDEDTYIWGNNTDDNIAFAIGGSNEFIFTAAQLDGTGARLVNFAGRREKLAFSWKNSNSAATRQCYMISNVLGGATTAQRGYRQERDGSIVGAAVTMNIDAYTDGDAGIAVYINGVEQFAEVFTPSGVGDAQGTQNTYSVGTYTFSAGDLVYAARRLTGTATTTEMVGTVEVEYDD
jgi:hypothetical protein